MRYIGASLLGIFDTVIPTSLGMVVNLGGQTKKEMTIQVGQSTTLNCNFSTSYANPYVFWYQQHQTQSPQMLLQVDKWTAQVNSGRLSSALSVETSQVLLRVRDAELQDSASYFCSLMTPGGCGEARPLLPQPGLL
uniref:Ig-like domain-containing protein n=1 Tax=Bubo bubo TaxID=30461 RepID=A0A8C0EKX9_BUBBB